MIKLTKTIVFHTRPKAKGRIMEVVGEFPAKVRFEYDVQMKCGKVGDIAVIGDNGRIALKPHHISSYLTTTSDYWYTL